MLEGLTRALERASGRCWVTDTVPFAQHLSLPGQAGLSVPLDVGHLHSLAPLFCFGAEPALACDVCEAEVLGNPGAGV